MWRLPNSKTIMAAALAGLLHGNTWAQESSKPAAPVEAAPSAAKRVSQLPPVRRLQTREGLIQRRIVQLKRFWKDVKERVDLSPEQRTEVDRRFESYIQYYRDGKYDYDVDSMPSPIDPLLPQELRDIYADMEKAKQSKDESEITHAQAAFDEYRSRKPVTPYEDQRFAGELGAMMKPEQLKTYAFVLDRWHKLDTRLPGDDALRRLTRASHDPALKLTEEQLTKVDAVLNAARMNVGPPGRRNFDQIEPIAVSAKAEVMPLLTPEQRKIVESTLETYKDDDEVFAKYMDLSEPAKKPASEPPASEKPKSDEKPKLDQKSKLDEKSKPKE